MARTEDHLAELLKLPTQERAKAARALLDSLDEDGEDADAEQAQGTELVRRMEDVESGKARFIDGAEAHRRVTARLRAVRAQ